MRLKTQEEIRELARAQKYGVVKCGGAEFCVRKLPVEDVVVDQETGEMHVHYVEEVVIRPGEGLFGSA